jgi:hypothetical protein
VGLTQLIADLAERGVLVVAMVAIVAIVAIAYGYHRSK